MQQHDVVVHGIDPFVGVIGQVQDAGQFAVGQFHHDGQRALAVQRGPHRDEGGVRRFAVQVAHPRHAERRLHRQPVLLLHLVHCDRQRPHLVLAHVVEAEVQRQPTGWSLENQLRNTHVAQLRLEPFIQIQVVHPVWH